MRLYYILLLVLISNISLAQEHYSFDYLLEYEKTEINEDSTIVSTEYYLTNSKNNGYTAVLTKKNKDTFNLTFKHHNGIHVEATVAQDEFSRAESINLLCSNYSQHKNPFQYKVKYYDFINLKDTIIYEEYLKQYRFKSNRPKQVKKLKLGKLTYVVQPNTEFHLPILKFRTAYEEWKVENNIPHGIFEERYFTNYLGDIETVEKLIQYKKNIISINITEDCNNMGVK